MSTDQSQAARKLSGAQQGFHKEYSMQTVIFNRIHGFLNDLIHLACMCPCFNYFSPLSLSLFSLSLSHSLSLSLSLSLLSLSYHSPFLALLCLSLFLSVSLSYLSLSFFLSVALQLAQDLHVGPRESLPSRDGFMFKLRRARLWIVISK